MEIANSLGKKLNIAMVCDPIDYTAGSIVSTLRLSDRFIKKGHNVIFIAAKSVHASGDVNGIKTYRFRSVLLPKTEGKFYLAFPTVAEAKKVLKDEKIDIIHLMLPIGAGRPFMRAAKSLGIKVVMHSHTQTENIFLFAPKILGRAIMSWIFSAYLVWIYGHADALICPTEFAREQSPQIGANMRYEVISNGVDLSLFTPQDPTPFLKKYHLSSTDKKILFLGRLHPEKSVDTLIKAMPELLKKEPHARLIIAGDGIQKNKLQQLANKLGSSDNIAFLGRISDEDLALAYNACDIFVLPSLAELEGIAVLEAMACGKPILIADSPSSASKYFVDHNGLLFKPKDPSDLAKQLILLLSNKETLQAMGRRSLENSQRYDIDQSVSRLEALYYSILSK